ncbi:MAG TPA: hypothetical protein VGL72_09515 [Bryobacteraceae bacterium]
MASHIIGLHRRLIVLSLIATLQSATVTRVFVESFGDKAGAASLRAEVVALLGRQPGVAIVNNAPDADFILSGSGQTYIKGYLATNPRVHYLNSDARPVYGGFLSVELKNHAHDTVWSYLVTPSRFGAEDINRNLARQVVQRIGAEMAKMRKASKP